MKPSETLTTLGACGEAVEWVKGFRSAKIAWAECKRGDWLLWILGKLCKTEDDRKKLVRCACECARQALRFVPKGEDRPRICIETAEAWCDGRATLEEVRLVRAAAYAAAYAADVAAYAAAYAADAAAADAADAAYAADAAADAADAADAAADAAAYAAYASRNAARLDSLAKSADIVRKHYPKLPRIKTVNS